MKKVVLIVLLGVVSAVNHARAQTPDARPATVQPATIAMLETMAIVAKNQTVTPAQVPTLHFLQAPAAPPAPGRSPAAPAPTRPPAAPAPAPGTAVPVEPPAPPSAQQLARMMVNVRFDVTITDTGGPKPVTKTVSLTVSPGANGSIRSSAKGPDPATAPGAVTTVSWLNVDVRSVNPFDTNSIRAAISVEYQAYIPDAKVQPGAVTASSTSTFTDGRRTQILVTSDPVSDRRTTIDVTATVLK